MTDEFKADKRSVVEAFLAGVDNFEDVVVIGTYQNKHTYLASSTSTPKTELVMAYAWSEWIEEND